MKYSFLIGALLIMFSTRAQLTNNGATIKISKGAVLFSAGNITNASGTITNDGKIEVQGDFINNATYNSLSGSDTLVLSGSGTNTLNAGTASINLLQVNKTGSGSITMASNVNISNTFDLLSGTFSTNPSTSFELIAPFAATFNYTAGTEITGKVRRTGWLNGVPKVFNAANMIVTTNGGSAPTNLLVNMVPNGDPAGAEREVKRTFSFTATGGSDYSADVTFPYKSTEVNTNNDNTLVPWYLNASEWNAKLTNNTVNVSSRFVTNTAIPAATFAGFAWKLADPNYALNVTAILRGAWNPAGNMNTSLNSGGVIPLSQPYNTPPFNYAGTESVAAIPNANVVDWVLLELRKPASGLPADANATTVIGKKAVFLLKDGNLADLSGIPIPLVTLNKQGASFVVVHHRNHLSAMSKVIPSNAAGTFANNFSVPVNVYKAPGAASDPVTPLLSSSLYGLWAGNANTNTSVNAADVSTIKAAIALSVTGYQLTDVNLSNSINAADAALAKSTIAESGSGSVAARQSGSSNKSIVSSVPD